MTEPTSIWSRIRIGSLIFGIAFVVLGIAALADSEADPAVVWVGLFAALGVAGVAATVRSIIERRADDPRNTA